MMRLGACLCLIVVAVSPMPASAAKVTPTQSVITLLEEIMAKGKAMKKEESANYANYAAWVKKTSTKLSQDIATSKMEIEKLMAFIDETNAHIAALGSELSKLDSDIATAEGELAEATKTRAAEKAEYEVAQKDFSESVEALKEAIAVLEKQNYDRPTADAFLQKMAVVKKGMPRVLAALIQMQSEEVQPGAPEVAAYEFQGGHVIALLEKLLDKFSAQLADTEETEANQAHQFALTSLTLNNMITYSEAKRKEKAALKSKETAASAEAVGELTATKATLAEDEKTLKDLEVEFAMSTETYEANQKVRTDELAALTKATDILQSPEVSASYAAHINYALAQGSPSFLQVRSRSMQKQLLARSKAAELLRKKAALLSSKQLAQMAAAVAANPFAKVIKMIEDLLAKLKEEAAAEKAHKEWCDSELKKNKAKREKKTAKVEELTADVAELDDKITKTTAEIAKLSEEQAELAEAMAEATKLRTDEKATNEATTADANAGIAAVTQATKIIKEFYASQASFLQAKRPAPITESYKGMGDSEAGVVGMLEVILSDFERLLAETTDAESQAAKAYAEFMAESKASTKAKHDKEFKLSLALDQFEFDKSNTQKDLDGVQLELDAAKEYFSYLKPQCTVVHVSYEERAAKRKEEIAALKEAYSILDGMTFSEQ